MGIYKRSFLVQKSVMLKMLLIALICMCGIGRVVAQDAFIQTLNAGQALYEAGRYWEVEQRIKTSIHQPHPRHSELLLLYARALFMQNKIHEAYRVFDRIIIEYPQADLIQSGILSDVLSRASQMLVEDRSYSHAGRYMTLLAKIDRSAVGQVANTIQQLVSTEVDRFNQEQAGTEREVNFTYQAFSRRARSSSDYSTSRYRCKRMWCAESDQRCLERQRIRSEFNLSEHTRDFQNKYWREYINHQLTVERNTFVSSIQISLQRYPLLQSLLTDDTLNSNIAIQWIQNRPIEPNYQQNINRSKHGSGTTVTYCMNIDNSAGWSGTLIQQPLETETVLSLLANKLNFQTSEATHRERRL